MFGAHVFQTPHPRRPVDSANRRSRTDGRTHARDTPHTCTPNTHTTHTRKRRRSVGDWTFFGGGPLADYLRLSPPSSSTSFRSLILSTFIAVLSLSLSLSLFLSVFLALTRLRYRRTWGHSIAGNRAPQKKNVGEERRGEKKRTRKIKEETEEEEKWRRKDERRRRWWKRGAATNEKIRKINAWVGHNTRPTQSLTATQRRPNPSREKKS